MRAKGTGSIVKKGGTFYLRVQVNGRRIDRPIIDPVTGKKPQNVTRARRVANLITTEDIIFTSNVDLQDLFATFLKSRRPYIQDKTIENYEVAIKHFLKTFKKVKDVDSHTIQQWVNSLLLSLAPLSVRMYQYCLHSIFEWLYKNKYIEKNPFKDIQFVKVRERKVRCLTRREIEKIKKSLDQTSDSVIIMLALFCGFRRNEIRHLKWDEVDFDRKEIHLTQTKNKKIRKVPMCNIVYQALKNLPKNSEHVFTVDGFSLYSPSKINRVWYKKRSELCISNARFHDLRATCASWMLSSGSDIYTVKEILGHSTIQVTERYLGTINNNARDAMDWHDKV